MSDLFNGHAGNYCRTDGVISSDNTRAIFPNTALTARQIERLA